jgi:hypothetical protein
MSRDGVLRWTLHTQTSGGAFFRWAAKEPVGGGSRVTGNAEGPP